MFPQQNTQSQQGTQQGQTAGQIKIIGNYSYNIRYCLGEGAYGKVFEGVENKTQMKVAIKKLDIRQFERDQYLRNSIISEIEILKRFNHRNIVKFIDLITTQRSLYIITEFCQHGDLRMLMQHKKLVEEQCLKILKHIIEGFKELLKNGVIHRDLKPANILIHDGIFKIADFGFAKYVDYSSQQLLRSCVGSPLYMAPQILQRKPYGTKCDVWSLGIIFHEMLFHDVPWKARDERELLHNILNVPFTIRNSSVSKLSQDFLKKTLVVDEEKRIGWDQMFEMFESYDKSENMPLYQIVGKENSVQFYKNQSINNNNVNNVNNKDTNQNKENKIRKSIFDKQNLPSALGGLQKDVSNIAKPIKEIPKLSTSQQLQLDIMKLFVQHNTVRNEIIFRHYTCVDLMLKQNQNKELLQTELLYEKLLLVLALAVKHSSASLLKEVSDNSLDKQKEIFSQSKELTALLNSLKKEDQFYTQFYQDLSENLQYSGLLKAIKGDNQITFLFNNQLSDSEKEKMEGLIASYGKDVAKELLNEAKKRQNNDNWVRNSIQTADYLLDVILSKKKLQKGQEVNFDALYSEKSEVIDLRTYLEKVSSRQQLFQTSFSFF